MSGSGTDPSRQDAPHPHSAVTDPTGQYLIVPDLGADLIRIFSIDASSGNLTACPSASTDAGDGPRHGTWWSPNNKSAKGLMLYTVNELSNSVSAWTVSYPSSGCLSLNKLQTLSTFETGNPPSSTLPVKAAGLRVRGTFLYAANSNDQIFGTGQDSLVTYSISSSGVLDFVEATNAHAWYPRTFSINYEGDLVATGRLGDLLASIDVATPGNDGQEDGLSAVVWEKSFSKNLRIPVPAEGTGSDSSEKLTIETCLKNATVPLDTKGSDTWDDDVEPFNARLAYIPKAVAVPTTVDHIQAAVACAVKLGLKATAKSGGHSYASLGLGGEDGHLMIELDRMYNVTLDSKTNVATVQPGARLGHIANVLWDQGKRGISAGTCPGVGVSGHSLHGGYGMSSHKYGLAADWIKSMTVVLANASIVRASASEHTDLFWALKGAGSSFGIVVEYEFDTFAAPDEVTYFNMPIQWNVSSAPAKLAALESYTENDMPADLTMRMFSSARSSQLEGMYFGNVTGLKRALKPLLEDTELKISQAVNTTWMDAFEHYANAPSDPTYPYSSQQTFYAKSLMLKGLNGTAAVNFAHYWFNETSTNDRAWWFQLDLHGGKHSAVTNGDHSMSSYAHRDKLYLIQFYDQSFFGGDPDDGHSFLDDWVSKTTAPLARSDWGMYINYADSRLNKTFAQDAYWVENVPRLQSIKAVVDPEEVFYSPQSIKPAVGGKVSG
ncbi:hypothetical protein LTR53_003229 [Teratosphaeriaceae sp. CCFEE 6253]|nr:hypothetical protein LTR53_003229 [Teratosphaeriaceae sp. CCFEE 6253]